MGSKTTKLLLLDSLLQEISRHKMAVKSLAAILFTLAVASAEVKETESGLEVEYISKPDACDKVARNADNALSRDEISGYLKQQVETMQNAGGEQGEEARKMMEDQDKLVEEIFAHEDKDKDGLISHE